MKLHLSAFVLPLALSCAMPSWADDDDDRKRRRERKESFQDGPCRVEIEWKKDGDYVEERKCKGLGDRYPERKEEFRRGGCLIKREWKKNGDYKEEHDCDGGRRGRNRGDSAAAPRAPAPYPPPPVYPPWIVSDRGEPVYRPGREPVPLPAPPQVPVFECRSEAVGRVLGGVAGAVIGSRIGRPGDRTLTTIGGAVAGVLIGGEIGKRIDRSNQACIGQALEFGAVGQRVQWAAGEQQFAVIPGRSFDRGGRACRPYEAEVLTEAGWRKTRGTACRQSDGAWVAAS